MSSVFVVDANTRPLDPIHPGAARRLLARGEAAVWRRFPFTIIVKQALPNANVAPLRLKLDPGSKTTGVAIVDDATAQVVAAAESTPRGQQIRAGLPQRRAVRPARRSRRQRQTRYRPARFNNRTRPTEWLPPSLASRVQNSLSWVARYHRLCSLQAISRELVRFATQLLQNAEISGGVEYQQGELAGYEVREYLLEQWGRACAYGGGANMPLPMEHMVPRTRDGSARVSNLTLACAPCNETKGAHTAAACGYPHLQAQAQLPLKDAAAVNATRWALYQRLRTRVASRNGDWGAHKVEPDQTRLAQNALAGCRLCGRQYASHPQCSRRVAPARGRQGAGIAADAPRGSLWGSAELRHRAPPCPGLSDGRHRPRRRSCGEQGWRV